MPDGTSSLPGHLRSQLVQIFKKYFGTKRGVRVFLFGSRATGRFTERSDYDLGVMLLDVSAKKSDVFNDLTSLKPVPLDLLSRIKGDFEELPIFQRIEVVDFSRVSSEFRSVALTKVIPIYEN